MAPRDIVVECIGLVDQLDGRRRMENQSDNYADDSSDRRGSMHADMELFSSGK